MAASYASQKANYTKPDQDLAWQIRVTYKYLKLMHHLLNVRDTRTQYPPTIERTIKYLKTLIKPAFPTQDTNTIVMANAKNWGANTMGILEEHYRNELRLH